MPYLVDLALLVSLNGFCFVVDKLKRCGNIFLPMVRKQITRTEVVAVLKECLQFLSKDKGPVEISMDLLVLAEWSLDSEHGVELATDLSTRLDIDIPVADNPLIEEMGPEKKRRQRTFGEVVDYLLNIANK